MSCVNTTLHSRLNYPNSVIEAMAVQQTTAPLHYIPGRGHVHSCTRTEPKQSNKQQRFNKTFNQNVSPSAWESSFCLSSSRGDLHVLLSGSVSLILPLILLGPHVKPKYTYRQDLVNKAVATKAWSEKKETTPFALSLSLTKPQRKSQAPDEADKVADQLLETVSGPHDAADRDRLSLRFSCRILQLLLSKPVKQLLMLWIYTVPSSRAVWFMYPAVFNYQSKPYYLGS